MAKSFVQKTALSIVAGLVAVASMTAVSSAQGAGDLDRARAAGQVGETPSGYIAAVGSETPDIASLVRSINMQRKEVYAQKAPSASPPVTIDQFAKATGCQLISKTKPGEKYQTLDGAWQTRSSGPPILPSYCPPA